MKIGEWKYGDAKCLVSICDALPKKMQKGTREISHVECHPRSRNTGMTTQLLTEICREADSKGIILVLTVDPFNDAPMTKRQLAEWYCKEFDFHPIQAEPLMMARTHNPFVKQPLTEKIGQIFNEVTQ